VRLESLLFGFKYRCLICSGLDIERFLAHANERGADEIHMIRYSELDNIVEIDIVNREATRRAASRSCSIATDLSSTCRGWRCTSSPASRFIAQRRNQVARDDAPPLGIAACQRP
jgi:hypothetical protein